MTASLWAIKWYEVGFAAIVPLAAVLALFVFGGRARRNRAKLRRQRQAERLLVRRLRAW